MNKFYPVFLNLSKRKVLVIGAGAIGFQKVQSLLKTDGQITVIAPKAVPGILKLSKRKKLNYVQRPFRETDIRSFDLVFCATGNESLNKHVGDLCKRKKIPVNVADRPLHCSFIVPAIVRKGDIIFAISTGGVSPALAKFIRKDLNSRYGNEYSLFARVLKKFRKRLLMLSMGQRKKVLAQVINNKALGQLRQKKISEIERRLVKLI